MKLVRVVRDKLKRIPDAGIPVYGVLGNHDFGMEHSSAMKVKQAAETVISEFNSVGIKILENEAVDVSDGEKNLYIVGIASHYPHLDDVSKALDGLPSSSTKVLFMHNANSIRDLNGAKIFISYCWAHSWRANQNTWFRALELDFACSTYTR